MTAKRRWWMKEIFIPISRVKGDPYKMFACLTRKFIRASAEYGPYGLTIRINKVCCMVGMGGKTAYHVYRKKV